MERFARIPSPDGGHRYWKDSATGHVAVSDRSGDRHVPGQGTVAGTPDRCDDGVLYLDRERDIRAADGNMSILIPLIGPKGDRSATVVGIEEALWVASTFRMRIACKSRLFLLETPIPAEQEG